MSLRYGHTLLKAASRNVISCLRISTKPILIGRIVDLRYYAQRLMWQILHGWCENGEQINGEPVFDGVDRGKVQHKPPHKLREVGLDTLSDFAKKINPYSLHSWRHLGSEMSKWILPLRSTFVSLHKS